MTLPIHVDLTELKEINPVEIAYTKAMENLKEMALEYLKDYEPEITKKSISLKLNTSGYVTFPFSFIYKKAVKSYIQESPEKVILKLGQPNIDKTFKFLSNFKGYIDKKMIMAFKKGNQQIELDVLSSTDIREFGILFSNVLKQVDCQIKNELKNIECSFDEMFLKTFGVKDILINNKFEFNDLPVEVIFYKNPKIACVIVDITEQLSISFKLENVNQNRYQKFSNSFPLQISENDLKEVARLIRSISVNGKYVSSDDVEFNKYLNVLQATHNEATENLGMKFGTLIYKDKKMIFNKTLNRNEPVSYIFDIVKGSENSFKVKLKHIKKEDVQVIF